MILNNNSIEAKLKQLIVFMGFLFTHNFIAFLTILKDQGFSGEQRTSIIALNVVIMLHLIVTILIKQAKFKSNFLVLLILISILVFQSEYQLLLYTFQNSFMNLVYLQIGGQFIFFFKMALLQFHNSKSTFIALVLLHLYFSFRTIYHDKQFNYFPIVNEALIFIPVSLTLVKLLFAKNENLNYSPEELYAKILHQVNEGIVIFDSNLNVSFQNKTIDESFNTFDDDLLNLKIPPAQKQWLEDPLGELIKNQLISHNDQHLISYQNSSKPLSEATTLREVIEQQIEPGMFMRYDDLVYNYFYFSLTVNQVYQEKRKQTILKFLFHQGNRLLNRIFLDEIKKEQQLREESILSQAKLCHEIKNPLNAIIAMLEYIGEYLEDKHLLQYVQSCLQSSTLLLSLLSDFQDIAQIQKNKFSANYSTFKIKDLMTNLMTMFQFQTDKKNIRLQHIIQHDIVHITTDENRLRQIIINLLSNAIKFTSSAGNITILINRTEPNLIRVAVKDTGVGISDQQKKQLFSEFSKIKETHNINQQGVGLGLCISQELALLLGPKGNLGIQIFSEKGIGSEFYFFIVDTQNDENILSENSLSENETIIKVANLEKIAKNEQPKYFRGHREIQSQIQVFSSISIKAIPREFNRNVLKKETTFKGDSQKLALSKIIADYQDEVKILVVDDDAFNLQAFEGLLKVFEINCDTALCGQEAIEMVKKKLEKEETYKLIFMDFEMPGLDGFSTANQIIKCLDSQKDQTNIIGCTGYSKISLDKSAFCEILEKPVTKKKIQVILKRYSKK